MARFHGFFGKITGLLGGAVFRTVNGRTYISKAPSYPKRRKWSERQLRNQDRFAEAGAMAKEMLKDPTVLRRYQKRAKRKKLPNARTALVQELLKPPARSAISNWLDRVLGR